MMKSCVEKSQKMEDLVRMVVNDEFKKWGQTEFDGHDEVNVVDDQILELERRKKLSDFEKQQDCL